MNKKSMTTFCTVACLLAGTTFAFAANGGSGQGRSSAAGMRAQAGMVEALAQLPYEDLSQEEMDALSFMVEEEKLARDVYLALGVTWDLPVFANIAESEQRHMDAVAALLDKYGLANPSAGLAEGVFSTQELQDLYDTLVTRGANSVEEALRVGATIEDLDIKDLLEKLAVVDNVDVTQVFTNLKLGSENHLRAFCSLLERFGYDLYVAQFLAQDEVDAILAAEPVRGGRHGSRNGGGLGFVDADGDGVCDYQQ